MTNDELDKYFEGTVPKDAVEMAGLYASIGHLSALVDEQRKVLELVKEVLYEAISYTSSQAWSPSMTWECEQAITAIQDVL